MNQQHLSLSVRNIQYCMSKVKKFQSQETFDENLELHHEIVHWIMI